MGRSKMTKGGVSHYRLKVTDSAELRDGSKKIRLHTEDRYSTQRYAIERRAVVLMNTMLNNYLKKHPELRHGDANNLARKVVYMVPGIRAWAEYMPGGFATYHVHNPRRTKLQNGKRIDFVTKALFRHSYDGQGLRSRAYAMAWFVKHRTLNTPEYRWLSVGCGTGQPTFDAGQSIGKPTTYTLIDGNGETLDFAKKLSHEYGISKTDVSTHYLNVSTDRRRLGGIVSQASPNVVDAMGLFEYLNEKEAIALLQVLYENLAVGGVMVFTNMLPSHPHIDLHKRGLGWPGVKQRTITEMRHIIKSADIDAEELSVMLPDDGVYAVYGVKK